MPANSYYNSPADLVTALNIAAANDGVALNAYYEASDVSFSYNTSTKKISMTGADSSYYYYEPVGYNSPNIAIGAVNTFVPDYTYTVGNTTTTVQQRVANCNLNLRLGYARPQDGTGVWAYLQAGGTPIVFDSYPNLIYTQCYYMLSSVVAGSSLGSNNTHNLLSVIPCSSAQLSVTNYTALTLNWLNKVPENVYKISIELRDDNNQLVPLPDNAQVNVEIAFKYD